MKHLCCGSDPERPSSIYNAREDGFPRRSGSAPQDEFPAERGMSEVAEGASRLPPRCRCASRGATARAVFIGCLVALLELWSGELEAAQPTYVPRNNWEVYFPYLYFDPSPSLSAAQDRFLSVEFGRRALAVTWREARINRPFYLDMTLESVVSEDMPMEPILWAAESGDIFLSENLLEQPDIAYRLEAHYTGHPQKKPAWEVGVDVFTRFHLLKTDIPAEASLRVSATHRGTRDDAPLSLGFFAGPEVKAMYSAISGASLGGYLMLSSSRRTLTRASLMMTSWSDQDIFDNLIRLRLGHEMSLAKHRLAFDLSGGIDLRKVNGESYLTWLLEDAPTSRYVDVFFEASSLARLPAKVRLGLSGRFVAFHTPDENIVRWYRSVAPEASAVVGRKFGVMDLSAAYTLALIPPYPVAGQEYEDSGTGVIPSSVLGQQGSLNISFRF